MHTLTTRCIASTQLAKLGLYLNEKKESLFHLMMLLEDIDFHIIRY